MSRIAIAALQLALPGNEDNLARISQKIDAVMSTYPWVELVLISELAAFGPSPHQAQAMPGPAEEQFRAIAKKHGVWLIPGSMFERTADGKIYNTASVIDPAGVVVGRYRKQFPFRPYELGTEAGTEFFIFDIPRVGKFGTLICYDLWFPETARTLACAGVEVILHPVMTTTIDRDAELSIARATAATNQVFVVDVNGAGGIGNGRSLIVGPAGDVRHQAGVAEEVIPMEIDLTDVRRSRELGSFNLGQPLKSFRDRKVQFTVYSGESEYLKTLGPLEKPRRAKR
jgi:predicted amidohydrolase